MRLPRFRLRTLMIVVAIAGLECWMVLKYPHVPVLLIGPLIGSPFVGILFRRNFIGYICGGLMGGVGSTVLFTIAIAMKSYADPGNFVPTYSWRVYGLWLMLNTLAGFVVGLTFALLSILLSSNDGDARASRAVGRL